MQSAEVQEAGDRSRRRLRWFVACGAGVVTMIVYALWQLQQIESGELFALALPGEAAPSGYELEDARASSVACRRSAVLVILAIGGVAAFFRPSDHKGPVTARSRAILTIFAITVLADLATTIWFFHAKGIDYELHPGIRLFGYAYGRTTGPVLGKLVQAIGVIAVASTLGRSGQWLLLAVGTFYSAAAAYNALMTW